MVFSRELDAAMALTALAGRTNCRLSDIKRWVDASANLTPEGAAEVNRYLNEAIVDVAAWSRELRQIIVKESQHE